MKRWTRRTIGALALALTVSVAATWSTGAEKAAADPAVERTRKQVRMLDDLYKTTLVLITTHYVNSDSDLAAGSAAKALFAVMKEKGWHEVRLVDATGKPIMEENLPQDDFEKDAIKALKGGKPYYDQIVDGKDGRYLRAATIVPVVMEKCTMCHEHYKDAKAGEAIGALAYKLKIE